MIQPRYLLDTNICIHVRERRRTEVLARFGQLAAGEAALSVITYGELVYGAEHSSRREAAMAGVNEIARLMPILPLPPSSGDYYGAFRESLARRGEIIGNNDLWIAAHAQAAGLILVTNNEREFRRLPDLRLENWVR